MTAGNNKCGHQTQVRHQGKACQTGILVKEAVDTTQAITMETSMAMAMAISTASGTKVETFTAKGNRKSAVNGTDVVK